MAWYFLFFGVAVFAAVARERAVPAINRVDGRLWMSDIESCIWFLLFTAFIGFRFEVGGDWFNYLRHLLFVDGAGLSAAISNGDIGYRTFIWLVAKFGGSIVTVNLFCAAILSAGLVYFSKRQPDPFLALVVAIPYLTIVVGMGYTRQAVAIGVFMYAVCQLERGKVGLYVLLLCFAATFHKTAIVMLPLAMLVGGQRRWISVLLSLLSIIGVYLQFIQGDMERLQRGYLDAEYASQGALLRVLLNVLPAVIFLVYLPRFRLAANELRIWRAVAVASVVALAALFLVSSSTVVDRFALYMLPIQVFVWSRLPAALSPSGLRSEAGLRVFVMGLYGLVLSVWLLKASHAYLWLPYQFYPFVWMNGG